MMLLNIHVRRPSAKACSRIGLAVAAGLIAVAWGPTFVAMWFRWFPAWSHAELPVMERLTAGDSYYTHGPAVVIGCAVLAWIIRRRVGAPVRRSRGASAVGWALIGSAALLHLLSVYARVNFTSAIALIGLLAGLLLLWGGWPMARAYAAPVLLLGFMVPLPMHWIAQLNFALKALAGRAGVALAAEAFRVPAVIDGSYVFLPAGGAGGKALVIENTCSGLRSLISLIWFAALLAVLCRARGFWRLALLALAGPLAVGVNVLRIAVLVVTGHHLGVQVTAEGSWLHSLTGLAAFAVAMGVLLGIDRLVTAAGAHWRRNWSERRVLGFLDRLATTPSAPPAALRAVPLGALAVVAVLTVALSRPARAHADATGAGEALPRTVVLDGVRFVGQDLPIHPKTLVILETRNCVRRRFVAETGKGGFDVLLIHDGGNRKSVHPPEVCLTGDGWQVVAQGLHTCPLGPAGEAECGELITQRAASRQLHVYTYRAGDRYTGSFMRYQAASVWDGLLGGDAGGAMLRISVPVPGRDDAAARALALQAAEVLLTELHDRTP